MKKCLNSNSIKIIAIMAMTIDHLTWLYFPGYPKEIFPIVLHLIGRITCPIMCYFIAEGYFYTKDINKYTKRLFIFAFISHFAYIFASNNFIDWKSFIPFYYGNVLDQTSVMYSLAWGLVMLRIGYSEKIQKESTKTGLILLICFISFISDWSCIASLCILAFGANRGNFKVQMKWMLFYVGIYAIVYVLALDPIYGFIQMGVVLSIPILMMYNGERGKIHNNFTKYFFYIYYPVHLFIIGIIKFIN